jgi:hypothetical protein
MRGQFSDQGRMFSYLWPTSGFPKGKRADETSRVFASISAFYEVGWIMQRRALCRVGDQDHGRQIHQAAFPDIAIHALQWLIRSHIAYRVLANVWQCPDRGKICNVTSRLDR